MNNKTVGKSNIYQKTHKTTVGEGLISTRSGITLIALIITIIIMLILTIVTIKKVTGDGLIEKEKQAVDSYKAEQEREENSTNQFAQNIDNQSNTTQPVPYTDAASYATYAEGLGYTVISTEDYTNKTYDNTLTKIALPYGTTNIPHSYFGNWRLGQVNEVIEEIIIPEGVTSIGEESFSTCGSLISITIPNSVTSIGAHAFYGCSSLKSVVIPESVTSIGAASFNACSSLTSITVDTNNPNYLSENGIIYNKTKTEIVAVTVGITNANIPSSVTSIEGDVFRSCRLLTSITIPSSVTSIGAYAFYGCSSLKSVVIPESVTSIEDYSFTNCSSLAIINFEKGFSGDIKSTAFYRTPWLNSQPDVSAVVINGTSYDLSVSY